MCIVLLDMMVLLLVDYRWASLVAQSVENLPAVLDTTCSTGDLGSIPGLGGSPGEGNGNPLQ